MKCSLSSIYPEFHCHDKNIGRTVRRLIRPFGLDLVRYRNPLVIAPPQAVGLKPASGKSALSELRTAYPFVKPDLPVKPLLLSDDGGGKEVVERLLRERDTKVMLEIGSFFGASAIRWASFKPDLTVVCVDPWTDGWTAKEAAKRGYPEFQQQLGEKDGLYHTFLQNVSAHHGQIIPVRAFSPEVLPRLVLLGLDPDLIYIDATKVIGDLIICHRLWPKAILTGDDWNWAPEKGYPMRQAVTKFAAEHGLRIEHQLETWHLLP